MTTNTNAVTPGWTIKRINYYYRGTVGARRDDYIRQGYTEDNSGKIVAVADRVVAARIADALDPSGTYYLTHGEYAAPTFEVRRIKLDPTRVALVDEATACRILGLDYDLECAA